MKAKKVSVLIVDNSLDITGALNAIVAFSLYSHPHFKFTYILPKGSKALKFLQNEGFDVIELPFFEISKKTKNLLLYLPYLLYNGWQLNKIVQRQEVDIVHVNDFYNMCPIVAKILGGRFRLITHVRFMPNRFPARLKNIWIGLSLRYAEAVVCVSEAVKSLFPKHPKILMIYDGLPQPVTSSSVALKEKDHVRLLYLAHYIPGKGQDYALEAFGLAYGKNPAMSLRFVGGDMDLKKNKEYKARLLQRAKELHLTQTVQFKGPALNPKEEIRAADIVLNFSESESFSLTCLEVLSLGTPLIATDCGGPAELFVHKESGWLVANRNIQAMKEAILQLSENVEIRRKFSRNSPIFVQNKFSQSNTFDRLIALYLNVLNIP